MIGLVGLARSLRRPRRPPWIRMPDPRLKAYTLSGLVFAIDRITKSFIESHVSPFDVHPVIPGFFDIVHSQNRGVAFGILNDSTSPWRTVVLIAFAAVALLLVGRPHLALFAPRPLDHHRSGPRPGRRSRQFVRPHHVGPRHRLPRILYRRPALAYLQRRGFQRGHRQRLIAARTAASQTPAGGRLMFPRLFQIGGYSQATYGVLVAIAFLVALSVISRLARRAGLNSDAVVNLGMLCGITAIIGAKIMMYLIDLPDYIHNPSEIFSLASLQAGGVFYGGLIGALIAAIVYIRRRHLPPSPRPTSSHPASP